MIYFTLCTSVIKVQAIKLHISTIFAIFSFNFSQSPVLLHAVEVCYSRTLVLWAVSTAVGGHMVGFHCNKTFSADFALFPSLIIFH